MCISIYGNIYCLYQCVEDYVVNNANKLEIFGNFFSFSMESANSTVQ